MRLRFALTLKLFLDVLSVADASILVGRRAGIYCISSAVLSVLSITGSDKQRQPLVINILSDN